MFSFFGKAACLISAHDWSEWQYDSENSCLKKRHCKRDNCQQIDTKTEHDWGDLVYESETSCRKVKICKRCNQKEFDQTEFHEWGELHYKFIDSCLVVQTCKRCGAETGSTKSHVWGDWEYVARDPQEKYVDALTRLRHIISNRLDESDLKKLCFDLGIRYEDLAGSSWNDKVLDLIKRLELRLRISELIKKIKQIRPDIKEIDEEAFNKLINSKVDYDVQHLAQEYENSRICTQIRTCERCGVMESRKEHHPGDFEYQAPNSCHFVQYCRRCGEKLSDEIKHNWSSWDYESNTSCRQVKNCLRCGEREFQKWSDVRHKYGDWHYESETSCRQVQRCQHCGDERFKEEVIHQWSDDWEYESSDSCKLVTFCQRCGAATYSEEEKHTWSNWFIDKSIRLPKRVCQHCGKVEINFSGIWQGTAAWDSKSCRDHLWDLHLVQTGNLIKGSAALLYIKDGFPILIRQSITGTVQDQNLSFHGTSFTCLTKGENSSYSLDKFSGRFSPSNNQIGGILIDNKNSQGKLVLDLVRSDVDDSLDVSGLWYGVVNIEENSDSDSLAVYLRQNSNFLKGFLFDSYEGNDGITTVKEEIEGQIRYHDIRYYGTSYSRLNQNNEDGYSLDKQLGQISEDGKLIVTMGEDENNVSSKVVLRLARED